MKLRKTIAVFLSLNLMVFDLAMAADREVVTSSAQSPNAMTYTNTTAAPAADNASPTTTLPGLTIKDVAQQSSKNNNWGMLLGVAGAAATGYGVVSTCWQTPVNPMCYVYAAGLVASIAVTYNMLKARNQSQDTVQAVNTNFDNQNLDTTIPHPDIPVIPPSVANDTGWQAAMDAKAKLEKQGWKFDVQKGTVTDPQGKVTSKGIISSPASMAAAGISSANIKEFQDTMNKAAKTAEQKLKGTDSTDMFADGDSGGRAPKATASADGSVGLGGYPTGAQAKLGINRDPAQVAGMKKDFNGSPIGVAGDSLFDMVDRRYQLHQQNGSFINP